MTAMFARSSTVTLCWKLMGSSVSGISKNRRSMLLSSGLKVRMNWENEPCWSMSCTDRCPEIRKCLTESDQQMLNTHTTSQAIQLNPSAQNRFSNKLVLSTRNDHGDESMSTTSSPRQVVTRTKSEMWVTASIHIETQNITTTILSRKESKYSCMKWPCQRVIKSTQVTSPPVSQTKGNHSIIKPSIQRTTSFVFVWKCRKSFICIRRSVVSGRNHSWQSLVLLVWWLWCRKNWKKLVVAVIVPGWHNPLQARMQ